MKRSGPITFALSLLCMAGVAIAQTPVTPPSGPSNPGIVTVNFNAAVLATAEAKRDLGTLQTKFAPREARLQKLNDAVETGKRQLGDTAAKLSDSERIAKEQDLNNKEKQLQRKLKILGTTHSPSLNRFFSASRRSSLNCFRSIRCNTAIPPSLNEEPTQRLSFGTLQPTWTSQTKLQKHTT